MLFHLATDGEVNEIVVAVDLAMRESADEDGTVARFLVREVVSEDDTLGRPMIRGVANRFGDAVGLAVRELASGDGIVARILVRGEVGEGDTPGRPMIREQAIANEIVARAPNPVEETNGRTLALRLVSWDVSGRKTFARSVEREER